MRRPLIAGNWKMHGSRAENAELIEALLLGLPDQIPFDIVVCPPFVYLWEVARLLKASSIGLGAQSVCAEQVGLHRRSVGGHAQGRRLQVRHRRPFRASRHI
jgi:triosephosphate isomerase